MIDPVLVIDDDRRNDDVLLSKLEAAGVPVEVVSDGLSAIEKLQQQQYSAVVLDPMIREGLNGYVVLNYIELEQPRVMENLFLLTGMSEQTIARTVPTALPRFFRKPGDTRKLADAVLEHCGGRQAAQSTDSLLLIEDDRVTAGLMQRVAEQLDYRVVVAHNGLTAIELLMFSDYAAVLLDLVLPDFDGFTILEYLRVRRPELLQQVIVITGVPERYASSIDRSRICAVLQKPVDVQQLSAALQRCVESKRKEI